MDLIRRVFGKHLAICLLVLDGTRSADYVSRWCWCALPNFSVFKVDSGIESICAYSIVMVLQIHLYVGMW